MDLLHAAILGIIQGLTEFLPVSSSGHLEIVKTILGEDKIGKESMLMTVVLHFATALSTIIIFKRDIANILMGVFRKNKNSYKNNSFNYFIKIILSMIPAVLVGFFLSNEIESLFNGNLIIVGSMLICTALLLYMTDRCEKKEKDINNTTALLIGIAQAVAILPGISRSGATISMAVFLGVEKESAAKFSFLMVVPLIFGKMLQDILSAEIDLYFAEIQSLIVGFIFALITGLIACKWMISIVKKSKLTYFACYCFFVGSIAISYSIL